MLFKRSPEADSSLSTIFNKVGWAILFYNGFTLFPYFWTLMKNVDTWQKTFATCVSISLILGVESATITLLFDPRVFVKILEKPHAEKEVKQVIDIFSFLGLSAFLLIAAYTFWFDYQVNLTQLGNPKMMFLKVLCAVFVLGSEVAFGCANIFLLASKQEE